MASDLSLVHRVRKPTASEPGTPPLLLLLHGVGSNEEDLMGLAPHLDGRFFVVSARAPIPLRPGAYAWYPVAFGPQGPVGDPAAAEQSRQALLRFLPEVTSAYNLDPNRVYLLGFSQGAIMSLAVALTQPEVLAGVVLLSGRLYPEKLRERVDPTRIADLPIFVGHGTEDTVLPIHHGREIRQVLQNLPVRLSYHEYPMSHEISPQTLQDIQNWFSQQLGPFA